MWWWWWAGDRGGEPEQARSSSEAIKQPFVLARVQLLGRLFCSLCSVSVLCALISVSLCALLCSRSLSAISSLPLHGWLASRWHPWCGHLAPPSAVLANVRQAATASTRIAAAAVTHGAAAEIASPSRPSSLAHSLRSPSAPQNTIATAAPSRHSPPTGSTPWSGKRAGRWSCWPSAFSCSPLRRPVSSVSLLQAMPLHTVASLYVCRGH